jgi:ABC-type spermidine/putrescine transport system permease subunit I
VSPVWTLANYRTIFGEQVYLTTFVRTLRIAAATTLLTLLVAYPMALLLSRMRGGWKSFVLLFVFLPFWTSYVVRSFLWLPMLGRNGLLNFILLKFGVIDRPIDWFIYNEGAIYVGLVYAYMLFMFLPIYQSLDKQDRSLEEAAGDLGATPLRAFWRVVFPLSLPGVFSGCTMVFLFRLRRLRDAAIAGWRILAHGRQRDREPVPGFQQLGAGSRAVGNADDRRPALLHPERLAARSPAIALDQVTDMSGNRTSGWTLAARIYTVLFFAFLYVPIASLFFLSFNDSPVMGFPIRGVTLDWYREALADGQLTGALWNSFRIGLASAATGTGLGLLAVLGLRYRFPLASRRRAVCDPADRHAGNRHRHRHADLFRPRWHPVRIMADDVHRACDLGPPFRLPDAVPAAARLRSLDRRSRDGSRRAAFHRVPAHRVSADTPAVIGTFPVRLHIVFRRVRADAVRHRLAADDAGLSVGAGDRAGRAVPAGRRRDHHGADADRRRPRLCRLVQISTRQTVSFCKEG